jgi:Fis family transcriptional regulator
MQNTINEEDVINLKSVVEKTVLHYLETMGKNEITCLYDMVLEQVEPSLFKTVIEHCRYNQSRAANLLGISRGTCRTKLIKYFDEQYCGYREANE